MCVLVSLSRRSSELRRYLRLQRPQSRCNIIILVNEVQDRVISCTGVKFNE